MYIDEIIIISLFLFFIFINSLHLLIVHIFLTSHKLFYYFLNIYLYLVYHLVEQGYRLQFEYQ